MIPVRSSCSMQQAESHHSNLPTIFSSKRMTYNLFHIICLHYIFFCSICFSLRSVQWCLKVCELFRSFSFCTNTIQNTIRFSHDTLPQMCTVKSRLRNISVLSIKQDAHSTPDHLIPLIENP